MQTTRFHLIRHALVDPASRQILYGDMDVSLCEDTLREEAALHRWLARRLPQPAHWLVTPLMRTRATAEAIFAAGHPPRPLHVVPALAEQNLGEWQGITHEALTERLLAPAHPFWPHAAEERPPGGESLDDVRARVAPIMEGLSEAMLGEDVVVIAHGGSIRAVLSHALGLTAQQALAFSIKNLSLTRIERHGPHWRVIGVNEEPWVLPA